jgi:hypothetical protein
VAVERNAILIGQVHSGTEEGFREEWTGEVTRPADVVLEIFADIANHECFKINQV